MQMQRLFQEHRTKLFFLLRYGVSGVVGGAIQVFFLYLWVSVFGLQGSYLVGLVLGFIFALIVNFLLQKYWTFRDRAAHRIPHQLLLYSAVALSGLALNAVLLAGAKKFLEIFGLSFFHGWYLLAQGIIFVIVSFFNLTMNFLFTFKHARKESLQ